MTLPGKAPLGYHSKILHIDLTSHSTRVEEPDDKFYRLYVGGGLLGTYYLLKLTPAGLDAFDAANLLIFTSSVVAGIPAAGLARYTVCAKSPLTGGIGETRCEGAWGISLKRSGYDALIFHGSSEMLTGLVIDNGAVRFVDMSGAGGFTVGQTNDWLETNVGIGFDVAAIGPAGENCVRFASIVSSRTNQAARMGLGAVMGAKQLKAVALRGGQLPALAQPEVVQAITDDYARHVDQNPLTRWEKEPPGFSVWVHTHGLDAALDVENYRTAAFSAVDNYRPEAFLKFYQGVVACPGCPNDCIKLLHAESTGDLALDQRASGIHQEITGAMGPNIGLDDIPTLLRINNLLNQYGLDPTSLGFTLSFAMELTEAGILDSHVTDNLDLRFGNAEAVLTMIENIVHRRGFGNTLAEGTRRAAESIGHGAARYALHVKGLEMVPFEPRSQTNLALGYATAPIGPRYDICEHDWDFDTQVGWDHTLNFSRPLGILERVPMEYLGPEKVKNFKALQTLWSGADALDMCIFAIAPTRLLNLHRMVDLVRAITGWNSSAAEIMRWGERRNHLMRIYNNREGLGPQDDTLPDRFFEEPIDGGIKRGVRLDRARFQEMIRVYYEMVGWDEKGVPRPATLYDYELEWTLQPGAK